jgi:hypothetical protein
MAAGLGFKTFATGDVLTANDTNGYLMQGVLVFADAAARDAAITSPEEGQFAYLKDTNVTTYYTGLAWANLDTTGMTNPMTTTGDVIYSSSGSTPARLGIGSDGDILSVSSGIPAWTTPTSSGQSFTQLGVVSLSGGTTTISGLSGYNTLVAIMGGGSGDTLGTTFFCLVNGNTGSNYKYFGMKYISPASYNTTNLQAENAGSPTRWPFARMSDNAGSRCSGALVITGANSTSPKIFESVGSATAVGSNNQTAWVLKGFYDQASVISSISFTTNGSGSFDQGDMYVYGSVI